MGVDGGIEGQVTVTNVGDRDGSETTQIDAAYDSCFVGLATPAELSVPRRVLVPFSKHIPAESSLTVPIAIPFQHLTAFPRWLQPGGELGCVHSTPLPARRFVVG